jgi:hypothetical protein
MTVHDPPWSHRSPHPWSRPWPPLMPRRGVALQRYDIPMRPSQDYPVETAIELELPAVPEPPKKA